MIDRASTFADPVIVSLLREEFVPVALDQAYQRRQQDAEGDFYRRIAGQGPRNDFTSTTQGFYAAYPDGTLIFYNNNRNPERVRRLLESARADFREQDGEWSALSISGSRDPRYSPEPPEDGLVVRVQARVMGGYERADNRWRRIMQTAVSRDNLWITAEEHRALAEGRFHTTLQRRIARYHLVDNTRGEPPMWRPNHIRELQMDLQDGRVTGRVHLQTDDGGRGYKAELLGFVETDGDRVIRLDLVASGTFWGEGRFTRGAPTGEFPLAVTLTLADGSDVSDTIPPQGSRGWLDGYLRP